MVDAAHDYATGDASYARRSFAWGFALRVLALSSIVVRRQAARPTARTATLTDADAWPPRSRRGMPGGTTIAGHSDWR
jgi:hypothetical protein